MIQLIILLGIISIIDFSTKKIPVVVLVVMGIVGIVSSFYAQIQVIALLGQVINTAIVSVKYIWVRLFTGIFACPFSAVTIILYPYSIYRKKAHRKLNLVLCLKCNIITIQDECISEQCKRFVSCISGHCRGTIQEPNI